MRHWEWGALGYLLLASCHNVVEVQNTCIVRYSRQYFSRVHEERDTATLEIIVEERRAWPGTLSGQVAGKGRAEQTEGRVAEAAQRGTGGQVAGKGTATYLPAGGKTGLRPDKGAEGWQTPPEAPARRIVGIPVVPPTRRPDPVRQYPDETNLSREPRWGDDTPPLVRVEKTVSPGRARRGEVVTYRIRVKNSGIVPVESIQVLDEVPQLMVYEAGSGGRYLTTEHPENNSTLQWQLPDVLRPGVELSVEFRCRVR